MLNFKEWFLIERSSSGTRAKSGLYPSLYTQIYNYTPQTVVTFGADAITYMHEKDINPNIPYSNWGEFKPYFWQDGNKTAEQQTQKDPNKIPSSL